MKILNTIVSTLILIYALQSNASQYQGPQNEVTQIVDAIAANFEATDVYTVRSSRVRQMLVDYVYALYPDDLETIQSMHYVFNASELNTDTNEVGLFKNPKIAYNEILRQYKGYADDSTGEEKAKFIAAMKVLPDQIQRLVQLGVTFGYDAWQQNGCAAPTPYLLILDPKTKTVYGMNLYPCQE